ncbi:GNAT family N-acetyltransferase [archaeon]|nr:GNAT family N-acetyltransferase [archaeon]NDB78929.1 GNAT family N-acetyltransferase [archaeon]
MELILVEENEDNIMRSVLQTFFSITETNELIDTLNLDLADESELYTINFGNEIIGFIILSPIAEINNPLINLISIEDIYVKINHQNNIIAKMIALEIKKLSIKYDVDQIELIISQTNKWLSNSLSDVGFICSEIKLEKFLPKSNNLNDVLELIKDCTPLNRIVQVMMEKEDEYATDFITTSNEIQPLIKLGWVPIMILVTYEPEKENIDETIEKSNQLLNWDDYSLVYYG